MFISGALSSMKSHTFQDKSHLMCGKILFQHFSTYHLGTNNFYIWDFKTLKSICVVVTSFSCCSSCYWQLLNIEIWTAVESHFDRIQYNTIRDHSVYAPSQSEKVLHFKQHLSLAGHICRMILISQKVPIASAWHLLQFVIKIHWGYNWK